MGAESVLSVAAEEEHPDPRATTGSGPRGRALLRRHRDHDLRVPALEGRWPFAKKGSRPHRTHPGGARRGNRGEGERREAAARSARPRATSRPSGRLLAEADDQAAGPAADGRRRLEEEAPSSRRRPERTSPPPARAVDELQAESRAAAAVCRAAWSSSLDEATHSEFGVDDFTPRMESEPRRERSSACNDARIDGYAALFEVARAEGTLDEVEDELFRFARIVRVQRRAARHPHRRDDPAGRRQRSSRTCSGQGDVDDRAAGLVGRRHRRVRELPSIIDRLVERARRPRTSPSPRSARRCRSTPTSRTA